MLPPRQKNLARWKAISRNRRRSLALTTFNALEPTVTPVCSMPSAMPNRSMFRRKGVTKVTYVAPDHFLRKFRAHVSVDPPTLSRMKSNLEREKKKKSNKTILVSLYYGSNPPSFPTPVSHWVYVNDCSQASLHHATQKRWLLWQRTRRHTHSLTLAFLQNRSNVTNFFCHKIVSFFQYLKMT